MKYILIIFSLLAISKAHSQIGIGVEIPHPSSALEINSNSNNDLKKKYQFGRYNLLFPFSKLTGWKPFAKNYRKSIGILEIICGSILVLFPGKFT